MGGVGAHGPRMVFYAFAPPPCFFGEAGGKRLFLFATMGPSQGPRRGPKGLALTRDRGAVSFGRVPLRAKKAVSSIESAPRRGAELRACAAQGWRSGGGRVMDARRFNNIIYHYIT